MSNREGLDIKYMLSKSSCHHIFNYKSSSCCCICKEILPNVQDEKQFDLSNHFQTVRHKDNLARLFKFCFQEPNCDWTDIRFMDIVENSEFDVASEIGDHESYIICSQDNILTCLICQKTIENNNKKKGKNNGIMSNLFSHLRSATHFDNIRDKVTWKYYPNVDNKNFINLHRLAKYCSLCDEYIDSSVYSLTLEIESHVKKHQDLQENEKESRISIEVVQHTIINCPDCGENIVVFEDSDADFILQDHAQNHLDFFIIDDDQDLAFNENIEYVCLVCQKNIVIFNESVGISLSIHFNNHGECENKVVGNKKMENNICLMKEIFNFLPDYLCVYRSYIVISEGYSFCRLCNITFPLGSTLSFASKILLEHISKFHHESNKAPHLVVGKGISHYKQGKEEKSRKVEERLNSKLLGMQIVIEENKKYLRRRSDSFFCCLCGLNIPYGRKETNRLANHVRKLTHVQARSFFEATTNGKIHHLLQN